MKLKKELFAVLMWAPLAVTLVALFFLPEQIPAHYGANGAVTRWGSKYEDLILPAIAVLFGFFMRWMEKVAAEQENNGNHNNENLMQITGICSLAVLNVMVYYFLYADFRQVTQLSQIDIDLYSLLFALLGIALIVCGNFLPKAKMNSVVGLRTVWSVKNERTWAKCQKFGGISSIVAGVLIAVGCLFFVQGWSAFVWMMAVIAVMLTADVVYSYWAAEKEK